jgi:hypothetical protein
MWNDSALIETPLQVNQLSVLFVFIRALRGSTVWCLDIQARREAGWQNDSALIETPLQVNQLSVLFVLFVVRMFSAWSSKQGAMRVGGTVRRS